MFLRATKRKKDGKIHHYSRDDVALLLEYLKPLMTGLGIKENSKEWEYRHRYPLRTLYKSIE